LSDRDNILSIAEWANDCGEAILKQLGFTHGQPPSQATWYRVLGSIDWGKMEELACEWAQAVLEALEGEHTLKGLAVDGKTLRGSRKQGATNSHILSAVRHELAITLRQVAVDDKTNEIPSMLDLISRFPIKGYVLTADALLTQRHIAQAIIDQEAHYILIAKENQPKLREDIALLFESPPPLTRNDVWPVTQTTNQGHGRIEIRNLQATTALNDYLDWPGVQQVFQITRQRKHKKSGLTSTEIVYGLTSLTPEQASSAQLLTYVRQHWTIENPVHWVRDVVFHEDLSQVRCKQLPHVMASLRNLILTLLHAHDISQITKSRRHFAMRPSKALAFIGL
jgi:predicted transposase YbfD/YdcC